MATISKDTLMDSLLKFLPQYAEGQDGMARVSLLVDESIDLELLDDILAIMRPGDTGMELDIASYSDKPFDLEGDTDLAVVLASDSPWTGASYGLSKAKGIPVVVICRNVDAVAERAQSLQFPIGADDLIEYGERTETDLGEWMVFNCDASIPILASCLEFLRKPYADSLIYKEAFRNAACGATLFLPGADLPVMTANQIRLAAELGRLNGVPVGLRTARMSVGIVASAFLMRTLSRAILRRAPLLAWAFNALIAFLGTILVGNACELFYSNGADIPRTLKALIPPSFGALGEHAAIMTIEERESQENV